MLYWNSVQVISFHLPRRLILYYFLIYRPMPNYNKYFPFAVI